MTDSLTVWAAVAAIVAVPVAVIGWFLVPKRKANVARASGAGTATAGDVSARQGGVAFGHHTRIAVGMEHVPLKPEEKLPLESITDICTLPDKGWRILGV